MTEVIVSVAARQLADLLTQEAKFLGGVEDQIKQLQKELGLMQSFLKDADARQAESEALRRCLNEIRDIAYDIEDVVETFNLKVASKRKEGCGKSVKRYGCMLREGRRLHKIRSDIGKVKNRIDQSTRQLQIYGIRQLHYGEGSGSSSHARQHERRRSYPHLADDNVVGFDDKIEQLVSVLVHDEEPHSRVVSICGMAGVGKTTLAKKVYNHVLVKHHFDCLAWVCVSQQFQKEIVWEGILSSLGLAVDQRDWIFKQRDPQELAEKLHNFLKENKCLVVLDDIWSTDAWDSLRPAFPVQEMKSKILLTTRYAEVAVRSDLEGFQHELKCLDEKQSWELFQKIAFPRRDSNDQARIEELGRRMVTHCAGLPLAITVLGGILRTKYGSYYEWQTVHNHVKSYIREGEGYKVQQMLSLSYDDLPFYLKPCFLYLALFPEDYEVSVSKLIHLWIAEGFLCHVREEDGEITMEDVAEGYVRELLQRCMIQVGERDTRTSKIKTCHMHDLMRDFCLVKAKQENFLCIVDASHKEPLAVSTSASGVPRLAMHAYFSILAIKNPHLRSFLNFYHEIDAEDVIPTTGGCLTKKCIKYMEKHDWDMSSFTDSVVAVLFIFLLMRIVKQSTTHLFKHYKKLRVLNVAQLALPGLRVLSKIGHLIHLRYLCLADATVFKLSSSLGKLTCLQTLDLRVASTTVLLEIPNVLWRMEQLRHLYLPEKCSRKTKLRLGNLKKLQTLVNFPTNNCAVEELSALTNLKELRMVGASPSPIHDKTFKCFNCMSNSCCCCDPQPGSPSNPPSDEDGPSSYLGLEEDPIPVLEKLPNLRMLALENGAFVGNRMVFSAGGFPLLECLTVALLPELKELRVDNGSMPHLCHFYVDNCRKMEILPPRLRSLRSQTWR